MDLEVDLTLADLKAFVQLAEHSSSGENELMPNTLDDPDQLSGYTRLHGPSLLAKATLSEGVGSRTATSVAVASVR